jgi:RNA polymerase sigma factor (sigma-70 family)
MAERSLKELMRAYREGDRSVQEEMLEKVETQLRGQVRKMVGKQIRSERESVDICQSILVAFHLRASEGKVDVENDKALGGYMRAMVKNKLANLSDRIRAAKRGGGTTPVPLAEESEEGGAQLEAFDPRASMVARTSELCQALQSELSPEELAILEGRLSGKTNKEIAAGLGKSPDAVRMTWNRARQHLVERGLLEEPRGS